MKQNFEYRNQAKQLMAGKYGVVIVTIILLGIISGIPQVISDWVGPQYEFDWQAFERVLVDAGNPALSWLLSIVAFMIAAIMSYATTQMFIKVSGNEVPVMEDMATVGFKEQPIRSIVHQFIVSIFVFLWTLLLVIPGIMAAYSYAMGFFIMNKEQDILAYDAVKKSKETMNGYRMNLFLLDLGYLGWYILGIFTLGILWFWIVPKHLTARTLFFNELYSLKQPKPMFNEESNIE